MKTSIFQHQAYSVPEWANYIARDEDGTVCAYETKPEYFCPMWRCSKSSLWDNVYPVQNDFVVACVAI